MKNSSILMFVVSAIMGVHVQAQISPGEQKVIMSTVTTGSYRLVVEYTSTSARGFFKSKNGDGPKTSQSFSGTLIKAVASENSIVLYTTNAAYAFYLSADHSARWSSQGLTGAGPVKALASDDHVVVYTTNAACAFYLSADHSARWSAQSLTRAPTKVVSSSNSITLYTPGGTYTFYQNELTKACQWKTG